MKKLILAAAFVLTTGVIATTNTKSVKVVKATATYDKNVIANAD